MLDDVDEWEENPALIARMEVISALRDTGLFPDEWILEHFGG